MMYMLDYDYKIVSYSYCFHLDIVDKSERDIEIEHRKCSNQILRYVQGIKIV